MKGEHQFQVWRVGGHEHGPLPLGSVGNHPPIDVALQVTQQLVERDAAVAVAAFFLLVGFACQATVQEVAKHGGLQVGRKPRRFAGRS
jgi:hypothetical protein